MTRTLQIRNVPDEVHRQIKARAALLGMSMSDYLLLEIRKALMVPTRRELLARIASRQAVELVPSAAELIRSQRGVP